MALRRPLQNGHSTGAIPNLEMAIFDNLFLLQDHRKWPLIVIDWTMDDGYDAAFITVPDSFRSSDAYYALDENRIHFNGLVSFHLSLALVSLRIKLRVSYYYHYQHALSPS
jgi:hypothetical protein